jgi:uncharacterized repeat protein (TIGR04076 family)
MSPGAGMTYEELAEVYPRWRSGHRAGRSVTYSENEQEGQVKRNIATVTRVTGTCNAGYQVGDQVVINRDIACIDKEASDQLCIFALGAILSSMCRIEPGQTAFASCPDPATGLGGNVRFEIVEVEDGQ